MVLPVLGFALNSSLLFFAPQYLFPYNGLVIERYHESHAVFSASAAVVLNILQWSIIGIGFTWFARRLSIRYGLLAATATIVLIALLINVAFGLLGMSLELDGP